MENWKECTIGDIADITMGQSPESSYYNSNKQGIPFLQGNRTFGFKYPVFDTYTTYVTKEAQKEDVIMSVRAPVGEVNIAPEKLCLGRGVCSIRMKNGEQMFLYYLMKANQKQLLNKENGTVFGSVNRNDINNLTVKVPTQNIQKKISLILSSLDDKIELNNKINDNLEQQAQAIFKSWFVDGKEKNGIIGDYCNVKSGFAFKSSWWQESGLKVVRIGDIEQGKLSIDSCAHVSNDKQEIAKDFILKSGDLVIAMTGATIGKFSMVPKTDEVIFANQRVGKFFLGENPIEKVPFIYCTLCNEDVITEFINRGQGSAQLNISTGDILTIPCWIPKQSEIERYNKTTQPLFETIISNQSENRKLSSIRDSLLPKLMSGGLDVDKIEL